MNRLLLAAIIFIFSTNLKAQDIDSTALIIIDIQEFYFPEGAVPLTHPETTAKNAAKILNYFRKNNGLVVHVRHNYEPGGSIHKLVQPTENEKVFSKDEVNAFLDTGLNEYLKNNGINKLVLCGMQTHMCLEAATRAAHDLGYECTVITNACTTRDLQFDDHIIKAEDVHFSTLNTLRSYAKISKVSDFLKE